MKALMLQARDATCQANPESKPSKVAPTVDGGARCFAVGQQRLCVFAGAGMIRVSKGGGHCMPPPTGGGVRLHYEDRLLWTTRFNFEVDHLSGLFLAVSAGCAPIMQVVRKQHCGVANLQPCREPTQTQTGTLLA